MLRVVTGNILHETRGILVHGVNCQGKMNAGIALDIKKKYPKVLSSYLSMCDEFERIPGKLLGLVDFVQVSDELIIASAFTQATYGRSDFRYVSYDAIDDCFYRIKHHAIDAKLPVIYPRIGAGLANGNWDIISTIINAHLSPSVDHSLFVL